MAASESDSSPTVNTCTNCLAEFEWTPFVQDGEEFCCSGCAGGGPCICTYDGAPHLTEAGGAADSSDQVDVSPGDEDEASDGSNVAAFVSSGDAGEPPQPPPAPSLTPGDEEPPTNGRLAIIMAAISEMPTPVQEAVQARLSNSGTDEEVGETLGLTADELRELIEQGQAILDRTIGTDFTIRYIGPEEIAEDDAPEPEFPSFEEEEETETPAVTPVDVDDDLGERIARSFGALTDSSTIERLEDPASRDVLSETLREVGNLLRLASERLTSDEEPALPLREALADSRESDEPITLAVETTADVSQFLMALQELDSVQWAKLQSQADGRTEFSLVVRTTMGFVRELMSMDSPLRPSRIQMSGDEITIGLPGGEHSANGATPGPRFEIAVDAFFGARHFIESEENQSAPHHHSYRVESTFVTSEPESRGFVLGFANVREMVDATVMAYSETLLNTQEPFSDIAPTTENLARVLYRQVSERLAELDISTITLDRIRVWESPTNSATYSDHSAGATADAAVAS